MIFQGIPPLIAQQWTPVRRCYGGKPCYEGNLALHWSNYCSLNENGSAEHSLLITNSKFLNGKNGAYASGVLKIKPT